MLFPASLTHNAGKQWEPVSIDRKDRTRRTCGECGGSLEVVDVDVATISVECEHGQIFELENDAFDAGFDCVLEFLSRRTRV